MTAGCRCCVSRRVHRVFFSLFFFLPYLIFRPNSTPPFQVICILKSFKGKSTAGAAFLHDFVPPLYPVLTASRVYCRPSLSPTEKKNPSKTQPKTPPYLPSQLIASSPPPPHCSPSFPLQSGVIWLVAIGPEHKAAQSCVHSATCPCNPAKHAKQAHFPGSTRLG